MILLGYWMEWQNKTGLLFLNAFRNSLKISYLHIHFDSFFLLFGWNLELAIDIAAADQNFNIMFLTSI